jgi:hypothetical protein
MKSEKMPYLKSVLITESSIYFEADEEISIYIIDVFTGDLVQAYNFPQPAIKEVTEDRRKTN